MPLSSRDLQRAAKQRLTTAEFLLRHGYALDAMYLGGYAVECTLKALILEVTPVSEREDVRQRISSGAKMHSAEVLGQILKGRSRPIPLDLVKRFRRCGWSTALRYESGHVDRGETRGFLKTAKRVVDWVEGQLP
jgi:HEPN domain-containing protein